MDHIIDKNGNEYWLDDDDLIHRDNAPAFIYANGNSIWYQHGLLHRLDGPAIDVGNGDGFWYIDGEKIRCKDNDEFLRVVKMKVLL
jgi:hypothetical protein